MNKDFLLQIEDKRLANAIEELTELYNMDTMRWFARLWDPVNGAFYYSNSGRDYEGFLPDIESTVQGLRVIQGYGMVDGRGGLAGALPRQMIDKLVGFVRDMADEDGYFYHKQWGKDIPTSRRGRDLSWSTSLLSMFGASSPYPTALERLADKKDGGAGLPEYFGSKKAFFDYLEGLDFLHRSYPAANQINAQMAQIRAAGLLDDLCDWLDDHQLTSNGLWQEEVNYSTVSGLMKLGSTYIAAGRKPRYIETAIDSAIEAALSDTGPSVVVYVYNPLSSITSMRECLKNLGLTSEADEVTKKVRDVGVELVNKTREKISIFRKSDGSFSYGPERCAATSQNMPVALPNTNEGDVNATTISMNGVCGGVVRALGYNMKLYDGKDFEEWLSVIESVKPVVKKPIPEGVEIKKSNFIL